MSENYNKINYSAITPDTIINEIRYSMRTWYGLADYGFYAGFSTAEITLKQLGEVIVLKNFLRTRNVGLGSVAEVIRVFEKMNIKYKKDPRIEIAILNSEAKKKSKSLGK